MARVSQRSVKVILRGDPASSWSDSYLPTCLWPNKPRLLMAQEEYSVHAQNMPASMCPRVRLPHRRTFLSFYQAIGVWHPRTGKNVRDRPCRFKGSVSQPGSSGKIPGAYKAFWFLDAISDDDTKAPGWYLELCSYILFSRGFLAWQPGL